MERLNIPASPEALRDRLADLKAGPTIDPNTMNADRECGDCRGTGWVERDVDGTRRAVRCRCTAAGVTADGVPREFVEATLANYREEDGNRAALARARVFLEGQRDLFLFGDVGAGKTRLACSLANEWAQRRQTAFFVRVPWMLHQLTPGRDSAALEERLASTSLLVLDDIGAERDQATDYTRRTILMLYEQRHDRWLRTVFTSNKSVQALAEMQDDRRLASRIIGRADVVELTTPDQRRVRRVRR